MNKSYLERMSGCSFDELLKEFAPPGGCPKDIRKLFQWLHDEFWQKRKTKVLERDGWQCVNCKSSQHLDVHHIKQRSLGGTHAMDNLETLCRECHRIRHGE